ncbi:MAG: xylulose kinase [Desulfobacteraceae bacterium]|nr:xylulose kinase [Desulfobacteraceae bacterium]MBC2758004.1 xylulose kinase [Desulfobacteraceae bacterium]
MPHVNIVTTGSIEIPPYVLAIDLGSGAIKVALVSVAGDVIASADEQISTCLLPAGGAEQDAVEWWHAAKKTIKKVVTESNVSPDNIVAIACDSQWSVVVPVNEHAEPLMRAVHWLDSRGGSYNRQIAGGFPSIQGYGALKLIKWIRATGLAPTRTGVDSLGHVLFIKNQRPDIYKKTYKFLEPMDYLTARLTGKITATQKTMAPFVIVNNRQWGTCHYSQDLLDLAGLEKEKFPDLLPNNGTVGTLQPTVAQELGLNIATKVIAGISDSNASVIGSGGVRNFDPIIYIGTSLYMTCHVPFLKTDLIHMMTSIPGPFESKYMVFGEQGTGGKCVEFFLKNIIYAEDEFKTGPMPVDGYLRFNDSAATAPAGSDGLLFFPWLNGSIVPCEDPDVRGGFLNLSLRTQRNHMARAIMEGIAYNNRWTMKPMKKFIGRPISSFRFSGGGALSDIWAQIHADVLGVPVRQIEDPVNTTVRGTGLLAFVALNILSSEDIADFVRVKRIFEPNDSNKDVYDKMYTVYRQAFKKNRKIYRALNG